MISLNASSPRSCSTSTTRRARTWSARCATCAASIAGPAERERTSGCSAVSRRPRKIVVDLGAGTADLLDALPPDVMTIGVDLNIKHLVYERNRSRAMRVVADANRLPFRDASVDIVTSSHFFHHFEPEENASILRGALRVARIGAMASDTQRHRPAVSLREIARHVASRRPHHRVRRTGLGSRGYTANEARAVGEMTGARRFEVVKMMPFRFGLLLWK